MSIAKFKEIQRERERAKEKEKERKTLNRQFTHLWCCFPSSRSSLNSLSLQRHTFFFTYAQWESVSPLENVTSILNVDFHWRIHPFQPPPEYLQGMKVNATIILKLRLFYLESHHKGRLPQCVSVYRVCMVCACACLV